MRPETIPDLKLAALQDGLRSLAAEMRDAATHYAHPHTSAADVVRYWAERIAALLTEHGE